jgi:hypothetical protein
MKTAEQILDNVMCCTIEEDAEDLKENYYYRHNDVVKAIEQAQIEAYNQALDDCLKHVTVYQDEWFDHRAGEWRFGIPTIDKESILKLKK